jgi:hypothetical protein
MSPDGLALQAPSWPHGPPQGDSIGQAKWNSFIQRSPDRNNSFTSGHFGFVVCTRGQ